MTVAGDGPKLDGIVFDAPSRTKVVVAIVDPGRGPVFRTVHPDALSERDARQARATARCGCSCGAPRRPPAAPRATAAASAADAPATPAGRCTARPASSARVRRDGDDEPTTETLRIEQLQRELAERERADEARRPTEEEHAAERRADKAAYLREKLDEQAEHPDEPG